ncbi:hypothetical protein [Paenibacillus sp. 453mf]|uniref:hypothetical protein n=1 Tax=Paenibacillus sp. 453mf TaxID=1761874 RepID=UPI0008E1ABA3|nr:hypothetical protein [Paenibacillus sp. 453mf]SFS94892.1 hypothetical protein SAMN04488601_10930 [Paenibacillus sp. 453mf]
MRHDIERLTQPSQFQHHLEQAIPVQVYDHGNHVEIGCITIYDEYFVEINGALFNRSHHQFISRPGY